MLTSLLSKDGFFLGIVWPHSSRGHSSAVFFTHLMNLFIIFAQGIQGILLRDQLKTMEKFKKGYNVVLTVHLGLNVTSKIYILYITSAI